MSIFGIIYFNININTIYFNILKSILIIILYNKYSHLLLLYFKYLDTLSKLRQYITNSYSNYI